MLSDPSTTAWLNRLSLGSKIDQPKKSAHLLRAFIACAATTVQTSLHLAETLRPTALPHMTARSTSRSRASCCCPCGLAPVVTVAGGTRWGDATPCYASHHMMLVLLCVFKNYVFRQAKVYRVLAVYDLPT